MDHQSIFYPQGEWPNFVPIKTITTLVLHVLIFMFLHGGREGEDSEPNGSKISPNLNSP
jgi:hypothetical protein